jgi:hypothetical protein
MLCRLCVVEDAESVASAQNVAAVTAFAAEDAAPTVAVEASVAVLAVEQQTAPALAAHPSPPLNRLSSRL